MQLIFTFYWHRLLTRFYTSEQINPIQLKKVGNLEKDKIKKLTSHPTHSPENALGQQLDAYKKEKDILLELSNDITRVREKNDLVKVFSSRLKTYFYFTHAVISLIDKQKGTYFPFLMDRESMHIKHRGELPSLLKMNFPVDDPFLGKVAGTEIPVAFLLDEIINEPGIPPFLKVNYECGIRKAMIAKLKDKMETIGYVLVYSDRTDSFPEEFINTLLGIAPHLSNAVANIIVNEQLLGKEKEKSFLLDFSNQIAAVRTKEELAHATQTAISRLNQKSGYVIRRINEDDATMSAYIFDLITNQNDRQTLGELTTTSYPINDGLQNRVLNSAIPLLFNVDREIKRGVSAPYLQQWKTMGFKNFLGIRLRNGETNQGILFLDIEEINVPLLQGICSQISIAMANIMANEQINKKQEEQGFLLEFSNDITQVRTKADLQDAISRVLDQTMHTQIAMIRVIDEDGFHLSPFMFDKTLFENAKMDFEKMVAHKVTVKDKFTVEVLSSKDGLVFNIEEELKNGNDYARLWKTTGLRNVYGMPLRVGNKNIGTIWILANRLSQLILKGICNQISVAIANIQANAKLMSYKKQLEVENDYLKEQIKTIYNFSEIVGSGEEMQKVYHLISLVADSNTTVLVQGETGTGKELIARAIHNASPRKDKLMVKVNCAALPANLIESELFGHERGAFTGAIDKRIGKFELANNSTLFLDEIGELPLEAQSKLLRVIQEREVERVGGKQVIKIDVRLIAATNRNLEEEVKAGRFRADLYFRLNVFPISLPPLRNRAEDIEPLVNFFVQKYSKSTGRTIKKIAPKVIQQLRSYTWPGNVRELEHLIERNIILTTDGTINEVYLPQSNGTEKQEQAHLLNRSMEEVERSYIIETLKRCAGKISGAGGAAEILKMPGNTLHSKMKKLNISKSDYFG